MKFNILSQRAFNSYASWHSLFEWEDEIASELGCSVDSFQGGY